MAFRSHMEAALAEARAAGARGEVPVGAVVVAPAGEVVAAAGNRTRELADPTAHAEMLALARGLRRRGVRAAAGPRALGDAGALPDVRGRHRLRPHRHALHRRARPQVRRASCTAPASTPTRRRTTPPRSSRGLRGGERGAPARLLRRPARELIGAALATRRRGGILRAMSLPPGFLDELRQRITLGRVVGRKVAWDLKKSNQAKGDLWAPCPFHQEKTASFHVDDRKGFYYCFGCHAKGDAVSLRPRDRERRLHRGGRDPGPRGRDADARAGPPAPPSGPRAATRLAEVMEMAVRTTASRSPARTAAEARAYLDRRGLGRAASERFELGWAGEDRHGLSRALMEKGVTADLLLEAGLTGEGQGGAYDRFWGRIIFPIRDARGRAIAFGGRSLDPDARAKYLNSPQTPLFDKGRTPVQPRPRPRGGRQGRAAPGGRGLHGRDRARRGGLRRGGRAARHRGHRGPARG